MLRSSFGVLAALCVLLALPGEGRAQVLYGSLVGHVRDQTRAAMPGADVTIVHGATGLVRHGVTNEEGYYDFASIPTGTYEVRVAMPGFQTAVTSGVVVRLNAVSRADVTLVVGQMEELITVTSRAAVLQTESAEVKSEITGVSLASLPVPLGRNWQNLMATLPGVTIPRDAHSIPSNPARSLQFSVQGTSESSVDIRIDGSSSFNVWLPHITAYVPSLEAIETVNVVSGSMDAEQGLAGGGSVNLQIKSGTNVFRGSAFAYNSNNKLMATPFFMPEGERNPKYINNQFGGTLGGPIKRDRLFFFASYEGTRERAFTSALRTIPSMAMRAGDLSLSDRPVYDPFTGTPDARDRLAFPGNIIPADRISPIAKAILDRMPAPTFDDQEVNNYYAADIFEFDRDVVDAKIDWKVTEQFNMYGRLGVLDYSMVGPTVFGEMGGGVLRGGNPGTGWGTTYTTTIAGTYVFTPTFLVDGHFGYNRQDTITEQQGLGRNIGSEVLGIPGANTAGGVGAPRRWETGWPYFVLEGFENVGYSSVSPYYRWDPQRQVAGNVNWTRTNHNIRFGGEYYTQQMKHNQAEAGGIMAARGGFSFNGAVTTVVGGPGANRYNHIAAFLLDAPREVGQGWQIPEDYRTYVKMYSLYVRDRWAVTPRLTASFGLRWEQYPLPTRGDRGLERYDVETNQLVLCGIGGVPKDCGTEIQKWLFAPRVGLAFRATPSFVIRVGYGLTHDPFSVSRPMRWNYPIIVGTTLVGAHSRDVAGSMAEGIPPQEAPDISGGVVEPPLDVLVRSVADPFRRGYIQSWNLTLQRELPWWGLTVEAAYSATRSIRQLGTWNANNGMVLGGALAGQPLFEKFGRTAATNLFGGVHGHAKYDALMLVLQRRFADGFSIDANYTFSKALGIQGMGGVSTGSPAIKLPEYMHLNRALSSHHMPHKFTVSSIFELPFGGGKPWLSEGAGAAILGGWQVNAILMAYSGSPFSVTGGAGLNTPGSSQRADQVKPTIETYRPDNEAVRTRAMASWFDPFAFAGVVGPRFGTASFTPLLGPSQFNVDFGIIRKFRITEGKNLETRAEFLNLFNTPHFGDPGGNVNNLSLNPDGTIRSLGGYTEVTGIRSTGREGIDQRTLRLGLRLEF